jgi:hypothetical protein
MPKQARYKSISAPISPRPFEWETAKHGETPLLTAWES